MGSFDADVVGSPTPPVDAVNSTILDAAQSVDPKPVIMDPLTSDWDFPRAGDNLHPTATGNNVITNYVALALQADGVVPSSKVHIPASVLTAPGEAPPVSPAIVVPNGNQPVLLMIGASFAAGVGVDLMPNLAWPPILGQRINYQVVVSADPGGGFINLGDGGLGPFSQLLASVNIATLDPSLVLIQGGHNDQGMNAGAERQAVVSLFQTIRQEAPQARDRPARLLRYQPSRAGTALHPEHRRDDHLGRPIGGAEPVGLRPADVALGLPAYTRPSPPHPSWSQKDRWLCGGRSDPGQGHLPDSLILGRARMSDRAVTRRPTGHLVTELWNGTAEIDDGIL
jgi:lysophospholipase L1-like esterase